MMRGMLGDPGNGSPAHHGLSRTVIASGLCVVLVLLGCGTSDSDPPTSDSPNGGAECETDDDCVEGAFCHHLGVCVEECTNDGQCARDELCSSGRCVQIVGGDCEYPCPPRMQCVLGECLWDCSATDDCPGGFTCQDGHCENAECLGAEDCAEGTACVNGLCTEVECIENADCAEDSICLDGECRIVGLCIENAHCLAGQTCVDGACLGVATPSSPSRTPCETNLDCSERQYCVMEFCRFSAECVLHAHCPPGQACFRKLCWEQ